ncbi:putative disease resistance RPP13-like protein 1 [Vitis vinifera]|uniref:Putative disease resistance RPP13-like protein 1 n=1 Tax=Vitis vinifera TaxID=29760 RepID=A0A438G470_VITVI|nr:putative disease resistance RPP13-like protein 1 [Vitis vinifera]
MALELVGGAFLSASLQVLFDRLASSECSTMLRLSNSQNQQSKSGSCMLRVLCMMRKTYWTRLLLKLCDARWKLMITPRLAQLRYGTASLPIDKLGLKPGDGEKLPPRSPSTSLVDESCVFGRNEIKEEMMTRLLSDNVSTNKIDVISIVGMGGAGKTTLAQLLYNDSRVKGHFALTAWVCVSEEFLLVRVTKLILEGIGCATPTDMQSENLDLLQLKLKGSLGDKKFLLVLDDVWEKGCSEWDRLRIPLLAAGKGSKVVVTTRNTKVAAVMQAVHPHYLLGELSAEDCWSLFKKLAFENGDSTAFPQLESIGRKIVAKCQGLPLAVKALGSLLYSKVEKGEWEEILESEIWGWQNLEILPSLILSYHDLPLHLKRCFAYCSIFPKDHEFDKEKLILLWMAEGFLRHSQSNRRMEEVDIRGTLDISNMENVACARDALQANMKDKKHLDKLALKWGYEIADGVIQSGVIDHILNNLQPHPNLKQFTITNYPGVIFPDWLGDLSFSNLLCLELWNCKDCSSLPPLGLLPSLQHLRISRMTGIERVGSEFYRGASSSNTIKPYFRSLQTLRFQYMYEWEKWLRCGCRPGEFPRLQELYIIHCPKLTGKLPKQLRCLQKLEIDGCPQLLVASLKVPAISKLTMRNFGKLRLKRPASGFTALQTSDIEISDVSQLKQLPFGPHHKLTITECDAVESLVENRILQTNLCDLKFLRCCFSRSLENCDLSSTLQSLDISYCNNVEFLLPELLRCHHPFLQNLRIFYCTCESLSLSFSLAVFPSLTDLRIVNLEGLEFLTISISEGDPASLNYLVIKGCPNLVYIELPALDSACYKISKCLKLKLLAHTPSSLRKLELEDCPELLFRGLPSNLCELQIRKCNKLTPEVDWGLQRMASLTHLEIVGGCEDAESFPKDCLLPSGLTSLRIIKFPKLKSLDSKGLQRLTSLRTLYIGACPELQFFAEEWFQHFPSLVELNISDCDKLQSLTGSVFQHLTSLQRLHIRMCPGFQSLTQAGLQHLTSLETLSIRDCPKLQYLTKERLPDSLYCLSVNNCPLLEQRCQFEKGQEWCYIAHIPQVEINGVLIFKPEVNIWRVERRIDTSDLAVFPKPSEPLPCSSEDSLKLETWNRGRLIPGGLLSFSPPISLMEAWGNLGDVPFSETSMTIYKRAGPILMKVRVACASLSLWYYLLLLIGATSLHIFFQDGSILQCIDVQHLKRVHKALCSFD